MKLKSTLLSMGLLVGMTAYGQMTTVDLSASEDATALQTAIDAMTGDSHILLNPAVSYALEAPGLGHALIIESMGEKAVVEIKSGFDFVAPGDGAPALDLALLKFVNLELKGNNPTGDYVANFSVGANLDEMIFDNCLVHSFRGVVRIKDAQKITFGKMVLQGSLVNAIGGYGLFNQDNANAESLLGEVVIAQSTISNTERIVVSKNAVGSIQISDCTFYNSPRYGRAFIDIADASAVIAGGVVIENVILSTGLDGNPNNGVRAGEATPVTISNSYFTNDNDFDWNSLAWRTTDAAPLLAYSGSTADLFADPANLDFSIVDVDFAEKDNAGDPRFYAGSVSLNPAALKKAVNVYTVNGKVVFGERYELVEVYSITGQLLKQAYNTSEVLVQQKGVVLIRISDARIGMVTRKVIL